MGALGTLVRRAAGPDSGPPAPRHEVAEVLPDPESAAVPAQPPAEANAGAAEVARRLDEARARLRASTPPPDDGPAR